MEFAFTNQTVSKINLVFMLKYTSDRSEGQIFMRYVKHCKYILYCYYSLTV